MLKQNNLSVLVMVVIIAFALGGCSTSPQVTRMAVDEEKDLSGKWNDVDSRMVSDKMISDCLNSPWLYKFEQDRPGQPPVIIV